MDPTQTPRVVVEPNAPRPPSMQVKQNPTQSPNFQVHQPGPPPGSPRYPIHNGSAAGPRLGGRPPPDLHRLDNRSNPGSPTSLPNQFVQQRPPFGPPRPQIAPGILPGNFPRALPPSTNPSGQPLLRYPNPTPSSNIRGPSYPQSGQRPPFNPNSQQFLRPQRPASFESGGGSASHPRFGGYPQNLEDRQVTPRIISETAVTGLQSNAGSLKPMIAVKDSDIHKIPQIHTQSREKMENNEQHLNLNIADKGLEQDDKHETPKHRPTSRNANDDNDNDDDDVIMDMEKNLSSVNLQPMSPNKSGTSKSPTPIPHSDVKSKGEAESNSNMSIANSPVTNNHTISDEQLPESQTNNNENTTQGGNNSIIDENSLVDNVLGLSTNQTEKSPSLEFDERSPDILPISPISASLTPSPDPMTGVMGYDNGKLRSLSPKSTKSLSPAVTPLTPNSPKIPNTLLKPVDGKEKENLLENIDDTDDTVNQVPQSTVAMLSMTEKISPSPVENPKSSMNRSTPRRSIKSDGVGDNGINPSIQTTAPTNGVVISPTKKSPTKSRDGDKSKSAGSPVKSPSKSIKSLSRTPEAGPPAPVEKKKVPMNKVLVGAAPSPNLKTVRSKIGSLDNTSYKPGGGKVKIENRKLDFSKAQPKIAAKNDKYAPSGGDKKITQVKLQWNAKPKVGSLDNATYKPGGGDKKIETVKLDFKDKAKPKVGSKENAKHVPGGGSIKSTVTPPKTPQELVHDIETQKIDIKAESKVGSMDNMKHRPGGGDKKIFNDRDYLRQTSSNVESVSGSGAQSPVPSIDSKNGLPTSDENLNQEY